MNPLAWEPSRARRTVVVRMSKVGKELPVLGGTTPRDIHLRILDVQLQRFRHRTPDNVNDLARDETELRALSETKEGELPVDEEVAGEPADTADFLADIAQVATESKNNSDTAIESTSSGGSHVICRGTWSTDTHSLSNHDHITPRETPESTDNKDME